VLLLHARLESWAARARPGEVGRNCAPTYAAKFEPDDVEFLIETERAKPGPGTTRPLISNSARRTRRLKRITRGSAPTGWAGSSSIYVAIRSLLRDLLWGNWDAKRFQIIEPGMQLGQSHRIETIMRAEPVTTKPSAT
jgi:hypothetical protein